VLFICSKIQRYSPTDSAKTFEKPVSRKAGVKFYPKQVLDLVQLGMQLPEPITQTKRQLLEAYMDVSEHVQSIFIFFCHFWYFARCGTLIVLNFNQ